jgi:hypothetical protein
MILFVILLSLFYGLAWSPRDNWPNIQLAVCDLDGGIIGTTILALASNKSIVNFTVTVLPSTYSLNDIMAIVDGGTYNAALVANPSASANLWAAIRKQSASYNAAAATSFIFDEGRGGSMLAGVLRLNIPTVASVLANSAVSTALYHNLSAAGASKLNAGALIAPVGNTEINLHRIQYTGQNSLGLGENRSRMLVRGRTM